MTNSSAQARLDSDRELALTIKRFADRSTVGLVEEQLAGGGYGLDLNGRFQNVMLSKIDDDGDLAVGCVASLGEANEFFGRNLETGAKLTDAQPVTKYFAEDAARHGMSLKEYRYYTDLIDNWNAQRAANPETATITIVNADGAGEGFNETTPAFVVGEGGNTGTTRGAQRLNVFNAAADVWDGFLDSGVTIQVNSRFDPLTCSLGSAVLGSAGADTFFRDYPGAGIAGTWHHVALANKQSGTDLDVDPDVNATFNVSIDSACFGGANRFYYGLDNATPAGTINLFVVLLHEMGHGLGFSTLVNGTTGALANGFPDIYSRIAFDEDVSLYWNAMTDAQRVTSVRNEDDVLWDGANVKIASGFLTAGRNAANGRVELYTPASFQQGSSMSHFNNDCFPNLLMEPSLTSGLPLTLDLTRQQMRDIGWYRDTNVDLVPDTMTNVSPAGGTVAVGSNVQITWTNTGGFNRNVTIELSTDGGTTYPTAIATDVANTGSFAWTVPNILTTQARVRVREHNFVAPAGASASNFSIANTPAVRSPYDFEGDGKTDLSIYRAAPGQWWYQRSSTGVVVAAAFGTSTDTIVPADYTGDGKTDVAFWRPSTGEWFILRSEDSSFFAFPFGSTGDIAAPADFDGDGRADPTVFRPSTATWFILRSTGGTGIVTFGTTGDKPVPADYDGDGLADIAIWRPGAGEWWARRSNNQSVFALQFGTSTDRPVQGDFTGDGKADIAFFRPSNGNWFILRSENTTFFSFAWGTNGDIPTPGDYDGDGRFDAAVFRPTGATWFVNRSTAGTLIQQFGLTSDLPVPSAYVR